MSASITALSALITFVLPFALRVLEARHSSLRARVERYAFLKQLLADRDNGAHEALLRAGVRALVSKPVSNAEMFWLVDKLGDLGLVKQYCWSVEYVQVNRVAGCIEYREPFRTRWPLRWRTWLAIGGYALFGTSAVYCLISIPILVHERGPGIVPSIVAAATFLLVCTVPFFVWMIKLSGARELVKKGRLTHEGEVSQTSAVALERQSEAA